MRYAVALLLVGCASHSYMLPAVDVKCASHSECMTVIRCVCGGGSYVLVRVGDGEYWVSCEAEQ